MHQFRLFGTLSVDRYEQARGILAGVCGMQPQTFAEQHIIFAPRQQPTNNGVIVQKKRTQQAVDFQRYYHNIIRNVDPVDYSVASTWRLLIEQEPEAGSPDVISQPYFTPELGDAAKYNNTANYRYVGTQIVVGEFFVLGNVVLKITRVLIPKEQALEPSPMSTLTQDGLKLLDVSGTYLVGASARLEDRSNSKLADFEKKELLDVQRQLRGAIPLSAPDRLSLDTRVREG